MITDARVLRAGFVPREVEHRDAEVTHLAEILAPLTDGDPGEYRCFNVDFSPEFRYCLEQGCSPQPEREVSTLAIEGAAHGFEETEVPQLTVGGEQVVRAVESVLSPLGWRESDIQEYMADRVDAGLGRY